MNSIEQKGDPWKSLSAYTQARIALGRKGVSLPLEQVLQFKLAHAKARDAVYDTVDWISLEKCLQLIQCESFRFTSQATDRKDYLLHPEKGRALGGQNPNSSSEYVKYDISIVVADGLSAKAINAHALKMLGLLKPALQNSGYNLAPASLVERGRVAISDAIGLHWNARLVMILIGERPGLSSPDSLGVYLTYGPQIGNTDEKRNCISNIRPEGLNYELALEKILYYVTESMQKGWGGVNLKERETYKRL